MCGICEQLEEYASSLCDDELERLAQDFADVFRGAELWHESERSERDYRKSVIEFKKKWLHTGVKETKEWIKTRDAMPLERERCLGVIQFSDGERVIFGNMWHLRGMWNNPANFGEKTWIVTHWTPYPALPEE